MRYGVHKVTLIHGTILQNSKFCVTLQKGQGKIKVKTTDLVHNFIILANCGNHDAWTHA